MLNELILDGTVGAHLAGRGIAAVEAHEGVGQAVVELALDLVFPHLCGNGVVDVEQGYGILRDTGTDILRERTVDINFAGDGDAAGSETGVDKAGLKAKLLREGRPALVGKGDVLACTLMRFGPIEQRQFELCHALEHLGIIAALTHLGGHVGADLGDALVTGVRLIAYQQIELGVLFDFHADLIQALDRSIAGEEVLRTRSEGDDLQVLYTDDGTGDGDEVLDHLAQIFGGAHRILGDIALEVAHAEVVGTVEHAAISIAAAVDEVTVAFGGSHEHAGTVKVLRNQGLGGLGTEVAQEDNQSIAAGGLNVVDGLEHVQLVLHRHGALIQAAFADLDDGLASGNGQADGEAVAGDSDDTEFDFRNVLHHNLDPFLILFLYVGCFFAFNPYYITFFRTCQGGLL